MPWKECISYSLALPSTGTHTLITAEHGSPGTLLLHLFMGMSVETARHNILSVLLFPANQVLGVLVGAGNKALLSRADRCVCVCGGAFWEEHLVVVSLHCQARYTAGVPTCEGEGFNSCACLPDDTVPSSHLCAPPPIAPIAHYL